MNEIIVRLVPNDSLTQGDLDRVTEAAEKAGQSPGAFVADIIKKAVRKPRPNIGKAPAQPAAHPAVKRAKAAAARPAPKRLKGHRRAA